MRRPPCPTRPGGFAGLALAALLLLPGLAPSLAGASGLDCAKAATTVEKTICADPALRAGDSAMADAFADLLRAVPEADKPAVRAAQRQWLTARNACPDAACLAARQAERLAALNAAMADTRQRYLDERARMRTLLGWPDSCEASYRDMISPEGMGYGVWWTGIEAYPLGGERRLYLVQCDQAAYQATYTAVLQETPGGPGRVLRIPTGAGPGEREETLVGEPVFDAAKGTLTLLTKARGVGDCGTRAVYAFPPGGGATLVELRARDCPREPKAYVPPERWPLVKPR